MPAQAHQFCSCRSKRGLNQSLITCSVDLGGSKADPGEVMAPRVHVSEKVRKQKPIQTIPSFGCDDIRAGECVWANDKLSENNVQSALLAGQSGCFSQTPRLSPASRTHGCL